MEVVFAEDVHAEEGAMLSLQELEDVNLYLVVGIVIFVLHCNDLV